jgi:hypothetical protein
MMVTHHLRINIAKSRLKLNVNLRNFVDRRKIHPNLMVDKFELCSIIVVC